MKWTKLSCHDFVDNQVRLHLFALAYNLGNFLRRLALPRSVKHWSLTTLKRPTVVVGATSSGNVGSSSGTHARRSADSERGRLSRASHLPSLSGVVGGVNAWGFSLPRLHRPQGVL